MKNLFNSNTWCKNNKKSNSINEEIKMSINNSKHSKMLFGLLGIWMVLVLASCDCGGVTEPENTIPPVITVVGFTNGQMTNVVVGDGFVIPEATAIDDVDGPVAVVTNDSGYDNDATNIYNVIYTAVDKDGNSSTFSITITVVQDTIPPVITVVGFTNGQMTNVVVGDGFVIPEATAIDDVDGPVAVATNDGGYNNNQVGMYDVEYSASDNAGNSNTFSIRIVVSSDVSPFITVVGFTNEQRVEVLAGDGFSIPEATAVDDLDRSVAVVTNNGGYNNNELSIYNVVYSASDSEGNSNTFTLTIAVVRDSIPPVIRVAGPLNGGTSNFTDGQIVHVALSRGFSIPEATATDNVDEMVPVITNDGGYDNDTVATYDVLYTATDMDSNTSTFMLTIVVARNTIPPVITVAGGFTNGETVIVPVGNGFDIPKATAIDDIDGPVFVANDVDGYDNNIPGDYTVVYTAADRDSNSNEFRLTLSVVDDIPPVITVAGFINGQTTNVENSEGFAIPEATATDNVDGTVAVITNDGGYDNNSAAIYSVVYTATDMDSNVGTFTLTIIVEDNYDPNGFDRETGNHRETGTPYDTNGFDSNDVHIAKPNLKISGGMVDDFFGHSVSISGDYGVIGANQDDVNGRNSGAAYIYNRSGTNWTRQADLMASDNSADDLFGSSVVIDGDYAVVGADGTDGAGAAYVFNRSGDSWSQQAKLTASDGLFFGYSVDLDGDYAIVGDNGVAALKGAAYIFFRSDSNWSQQAKLIASDGMANDQFGYSVAIDGIYAIVGLRNREDAIGEAYIFVRVGNNWTQHAKLTASDGRTNDRFGASVAIDGDYVVVGAWNRNSAYVFLRNGNNWTQQAKLTASDGMANDQFGVSVAIDGDTVIVGANFDDDNGNGSGSAYIFNRSGGDWIEQAKLIASDGDGLDNYGVSVAIDSSYVLVGAERADATNGVPRTGSAYIYQLRR